MTRRETSQSDDQAAGGDRGSPDSSTKAPTDHEELLRKTLEAAEVGTWEWDLRDDCVVWSPNIESILKLAPGSFEGTYAAWLAMVHPDDLAEFEGHIADALAGPRPYDMELRFVRPDATEGWVSARGYVVCDDAGQPLCMRGIVMDITARRTAEEALSMHARVLDSMREGVSVADEQDVIAYTNPAEDQMFGYARGELVGQHVTVQNAYPEEKNRRIVEAVIEQLKAHGAWTGEWRNKRKDGTVFTTRSQITALRQNGRSYWVCVQEDVSEQVRARDRAQRLAESLEERERLLRLVTDAVPAAIGYVGTDGRYLFANQAYRAWLGKTPDRVVGYSIEEVLGAENYARVEGFVQRAFAGERVTYETPFTSSDGRTLYVQPNYIPDLDDAGGVRGLIVLTLNLTERREAERLVQAERERLHAVLMEAPAAISIRSGPELVFSFVNPTFRSMNGGKDLLNKRQEDVLPRHFDPAYVKFLRQVYDTGETLRRSEAPFLIEGEDGEVVEHFFNLIYQPSRNADGEVDSVVSFAVDVTEQVEARRRAEALVEEANAASLAKDEFLAMLGHELRNPLAPIRTAVELMKMRDEHVFERERTVIERQLQHAVRLVDDLLDVSRIARGKVVIDSKRVDVSRCVAAAVELASPLLEQRQHQVSMDLVPDLFVLGDETRLTQIFANLLTNAAKYTPPKGTIAVGSERQGAETRLWVRDSGVGLAEDMFESVFELFVQTRQTLERSEGGLGLGLAIVRSLVELHGGSVRAQSDGPGRGSTFTVTLPLAPAARRSPARRGATHMRQPRRGQRVMVVDDNEDAADLLAQALRRLGHEVRIAHDGHAALKLLDGFDAEVALLDIGLPVMDGYELARAIHSSREQATPTLIAVTGYGDDKARRASREAGFDAHLTKPVDVAQLAKLLELGE